MKHLISTCTFAVLPHIAPSCFSAKPFARSASNTNHKFITLGLMLIISRSRVLCMLINLFCIYAVHSALAIGTIGMQNRSRSYFTKNICEMLSREPLKMLKWFTARPANLYCHWAIELNLPHHRHTARCPKVYLMSSFNDCFRAVKLFMNINFWIERGSKSTKCLVFIWSPSRAAKASSGFFKIVSNLFQSRMTDFRFLWKQCHSSISSL